MTTTQDRSQIIGGSDLGAVFSLPPYGCRRRLWYEKTGAAPDYPLIETAAMRRGKLFEPIIRRMYEIQSGLSLQPGPINLVDPTRPYSTGQLDGRVQDNGITRPWEAKCPGERMFIKIKREGMSEEYILQLQKYIHLDGSEAGTYAVFHADSVDMLTFDLARDEGLIQEIAKAEVSFWREVQERTEPPRLDAADKRCVGCNWRTTCQGALLMELVGKDAGSDLELDPSLAPLMAEYWQAKEIYDEAEALLDGVKQRIKDHLDEAVAVETKGARIYYRPVESKRWDTKSLAKDHPELAEQYKKLSVSRPLRVFAI